jgi:hypothetical protein
VIKVHPIKSPSFFSQSKNLTASTLLNNIKQNQIEKSKNAESVNNQIYGTFNENEIFKNNLLNSQMNGLKNPYLNYIQQMKFQPENFQIFKGRNNIPLGNNLFTKNKPKTIKSGQNLTMLKQHEEKTDVFERQKTQEINIVLLNIRIKTDNGLKTIQIKKRDNVTLIVEKFCKENKLNSNLVSPIHHYINKAMSSIDEVLNKNNVNENELHKIKDIHDKYTESSLSTSCDDVNLTCMSAMNDENETENEKLLNKTL